MKDSDSINDLNEIKNYVKSYKGHFKSYKILDKIESKIIGITLNEKFKDFDEDYTFEINHENLESSVYSSILLAVIDESKPWIDQVNYANTFIKHKAKKGEYLKNDDDFIVVKQTRDYLSQMWDHGRIGDRSCLDDQLKITNTLIEFDSYIQLSKAYI